MSYPRTIDDLAPSQKVSGPVVTIDYDLLGGLPADRDLFDRLTRHEVNAWAIKEDKPLIETR